MRDDVVLLLWLHRRQLRACNGRSVFMADMKGRTGFTTLGCGSMLNV